MKSSKVDSSSQSFWREREVEVLVDLVLQFSFRSIFLGYLPHMTLVFMWLGDKGDALCVLSKVFDT